MKRILFVTAILFVIITATQAQDAGRKFQKFKGSVSLGYALFPGNSDIKNGFIVSLEPKYGVLDNLYVGARTEFTFLANETRNIEGYKDGDIKFKVYGSFLATADFYFTSDYKIRPFVGLGGGPFLVASTNTAYQDSYNNNEDGNNSTIKFGGMARIGVEIKHFRIGVEYNLVGTSTDIYTYYDANSYQYLTKAVEIKNSYFGFKAGVCFGGRPKDGHRKHKR